MGAVQDPYFWKRFSVAVHQADAEKEEGAKRPELKHSYVNPLSASASEPASPTSQSRLSTAFNTLPPTSQPLSSVSNFSHPKPLSRIATRRGSPDKELGPLTFSQPTSPITPTAPTTPRRLTKQPSTKAKPAKSPRRPSLAHNPFRHGNGSQLTLGLSGRPQSRFKFWTSVTADPSNRDSWLESQRKKKRQRTWMCWSFWLCFAVLVAGIVVAILLLKAKKII